MLLLSGAALTAPSKRPEADNALLVKPHDVPHPEMGPFQYAKMLRNNPACHAAREDEGVPKNTVRMGKGSRGGPGPFFFNHEVRPVKMMISEGCNDHHKTTRNLRRGEWAKDFWAPSAVIRRGVVGIPIPKCASTGMGRVVKQSMYEYCGRLGNYRGEHERMEGEEGIVYDLSGREAGRFDQGPITTSEDYLRAIAQNSTTWTIVRDPFTRFVSGVLAHCPRRGPPPVVTDLRPLSAQAWCRTASTGFANRARAVHWTRRAIRWSSSLSTTRSGSPRSRKSSRTTTASRSTG